MHEAKGCTITDPRILKCTFSKNCFWKAHGKWVFNEPATFALTKDDRTGSVSNDAPLDGGTHFLTIAEEQYPGYYDVFEHVFEATIASFDGVPVVEASRGPEQSRWVLNPGQNIPPVTLSAQTGVFGSYHRGGPTQVGELLHGCTVQSERC